MVLVLAPAIAAAQAQIETDPTRPPAVVTAEVPQGAAPANQLQSVVISPTRRAAIINGQVVELGGKYGDAVLMRVAENEVVLKSGDSQQVLKLHPSVDMKYQVAQAEPLAPAAKSAPSKPKSKSKSKAKAKAKAKPKASTPGGAKPVAESGAGTR